MNTHFENLGRGFLFFALVAMCGCDFNRERVATGELRKDVKTVALGGARSAQVTLNMKAGELRVTGGATDLLDGDFIYNVAEWKPELTYEVNGGVGNLQVTQPGSDASVGNTRNEWDVRLNSATPTELNVNMGAGRATLTLSGMALNRLEFNMGAGETTVDLTGNWRKDLSAQIHGGVGKATVRLPRDIGVHVIAHGGLGAINAHDLQKEGDAYVNELYGKSPITLSVEVEGGVGEIDLETVGEPPAA